MIMPVAAYAQPAQNVQGVGTSSTPSGGALSVNCVSGCSGGAGPGNVTIINPLGSKASAAGVSVTIANDQAAIPTNSTLQAGSAIVGKVGIDQTTPGTTNGVQVNAALPAGTNIIGKTGIDQTTPGTTNGVAIAPSSTAGVGLTPIISAAAENSHVLKASAGNLYGVYATNLTNTPGFLQIFNATSAPVDGAVTPAACVALPPTGTANISRSPGPPAIFSTGITAVVSSASTCFTKTTGTITAFFSGDVQ